ncbi:MAG: DUF3857 domain-containing protein [Prosthecobacter sp.]|uniref:DUF3857 domain-containing protein n=1 Tax=Prosthecobacter sp. TaxID=1965333 RepID=UPI0039043DAD
MIFHTLADVNSNAYQAGQAVGFFIIALPTLIGILKCLSLLKRPTTSKLCVIALTLMLTGWLAAALGQGVGLFLPAWAGIAQTIAGLVAVVLFLSAFVLAIVGLACYDRTRLTQGRAQAVWTLVIGGIFLLIAGAGAVMALRTRILAEELAAQNSPDKTVTSEEFNCALTAPPRWVKMNASSLNKLACIAFRRSGPEGYAMVLGEHLDADMAIEDLMDAVKANLAAAATSVEDDKTEKITLNGIDFMRRTCIVRTTEALGIPMYFDQWVTTRPGFSWQITCWGPSAGRERLAPEFRTLMESFKVLDEKRIGSPSAVIANVERPAWGYRTQLQANDWKQWPAHGQALADFAALRPLEALLVIPVDLGEKAPDLESLATALLGRLDIPYPSDEGWVAKPWPCAWGDGLEITGSRTVDDTAYDYVLRVAMKDRLAHLHVGWVTKKKGDLARVRAALDAITLLPPQGQPPALQASQRQDAGLVFNDIGIALYKRDQFKAAAQWFKRGFEQTSKDAAILGNAADAMEQLGQFKEALQLLAPQMPSFPKSPTLHLRHAYILSGNNNNEAANAAFLQAISAGLKDENKTLDWLQHLNGKEQFALAAQSAEAWMKKFPGINSRRWHAQTVASAGDAKRGIQLFEELATEFPDDRRVSYDLGEALNDADEHARAAVVAEKLLADGKEAPRALMILGWSQMGRKWYREAKLTFEKVAKKDPENETVQDAVRRASAMLGQGSNSDIKTPVEAVALPAVVQQALTAHPAAKDYGSDQPYAWLLTAKGYHFDPAKPMRHTWHRRAHIYTTEGANDLSSIEFAFDPLSERIFINRVEVRDETGKIIGSAPGDAYVMDIDNGSASHRKKLHFQIPGLRPGCTVEYEVSTEDFGKTETFTFERKLFGDSAADIVFVTGVIDQVQTTTAHTEALQTVREKNLLAWMGFNLPFDPDEPMNGYYEDRVPGVCFGGMEGTWAEIGEKFLKDIQERFKPESKVTELAAQLTSGMKTPREKIAALAGHVQKEISYTAIEFGTRARRPNPAAQTLQQQYGDCKDQALLLHQLLTAAGIESHLALVNTNWRTQPALPTLDQFNHMVVHVPSLGAGWLIDTTNKNLPPDAWPADDLWHSHALILQPGQVRLGTPQAEPAADSCRVASRRIIRPEGDAWHVEETLTLHGYYAAGMRSAFTGLDTAAQLRKAQSILEKNARVQVHSFTFATLASNTDPARLTISYDVPGRLHDEGGLHRAVLPALWETDYLVTTFVKARQTPFLVRYPFRFRSEVIVENIQGVTSASVQALNQSATGTFTRWQLNTAADSKTITIRFEFDSIPGAHPAASYSKWHDEWNAALKAWDRPLVWQP